MTKISDFATNEVFGINDELLVEDTSAGVNKNATMQSLVDMLPGYNLFRNYPKTYSGASGAVAEEFMEGYNVTSALEVDAVTEGISGSPNRVLLKVVPSTTSGQVKQTFLPSRENAIKAAGGDISFGAWIYCATAQTITVRTSYFLGSTIVIQDVDSVFDGSGQWKYAESNGTYPASVTSVAAGVFAKTGTPTFYVANPMVGMSKIAGPFVPRKLVYRAANGTRFDGDPATGWVTHYFQTNTSLDAALVHMAFGYRNETTSGTIAKYDWGVRNTDRGLPSELARARGTFTSGRHWNHVLAPCDDIQRIAINDNAVAGDTVKHTIATNGYWCWEGSK